MRLLYLCATDRMTTVALQILPLLRYPPLPFAFTPFLLHVGEDICIYFNIGLRQLRQAARRA
jgi:hypothetical protein